MTITPSILQTPSQVMRISNFYPSGNGQALNCTNSNGRVALGTTSNVSNDIMLCNGGTVPIFVAFGDVTVTAAAPVDATPANGVIVLPGAYLVLNKGSLTYIAGITASGTATLYFYQGYGS